MKFGYARVSKHDQSLEIQIEKLKKAGCDEIYQEKQSGKKNNRSELNKLLAKLRTGDTVCVVRLDRLGRRMIKLIEMVNDFKTKGIELVSIENNIDTNDSMGMLLFTMCAAFAEMEQILISERVRAGLSAARAKGRKGGRPKAITTDKLKKLRSYYKSQDFSVTEMCNMLNISRSSYYRAINDGMLL